MNAAETLASWRAECGGRVGGDNVLHHAGRTFVLDPHPRALKNGAIEGRVFRFGPTGLIDIGGYKIATDGTIDRLPDEVRDPLAGPSVTAPLAEDQPHEPARLDA